MSSNILIINSEDHAFGTSTNFTVKLPFIIENAKSLTLKHFRGPNLMYNVSTSNNSIVFTASSTQYTTTINPGAYTSDTLLAAITTTLNTTNNNSFACTINPTTY